MKTQLTIKETDELCDLVSRILDGPEQGVITNSGIEAKEKKLVTLLRSRGYQPYGQKIGYLDRQEVKS